MYVFYQKFLDSPLHEGPSLQLVREAWLPLGTATGKILSGLSHDVAGITGKCFCSRRAV